jgi:tripartite-type tricarboxylate transporter receptor subunit TctC
VRRRALLAAAALPAASAPLRPARAQAFPSRPVTWVVPSGPAGVLDVGARLIAQKMTPRLGQAVVVENRPGAGTTIGAEYAARAAPDGHTVFYGNITSFATAPFLYPNLRYDPERDFVPVHGIGASANILVAGAGRPFRDVPGLVEAARRAPEAVTYASTGIGTGPHLAAELFAQAARLRLTHVPYTAFAQALNDMAAGRVDIMFDYPLSSLPHVREGRLRALAVNAPQRLAAAPEVPTLAESGVPGAEMLGWAGLYAPARTPPEAVAKLKDALVVALRDEEVIRLFDSTGTILWTGVDAEGMRRVLAEELPRMRELLSRSGARPG